MQERVDTEEDKAWQREIFGDDQPEGKRKDESKEDESPETKRRRTQEEEDWHDDFWTSADRTSRDISLEERGEIEDRVIKWIQEIERVVED
eukprot:174980-Karenia_brevis.AAC.1